MTQQEFRAIASLYPSRVNIWCADSGPPYGIYAITMPLVSLTGQNMLPYLQLVLQFAIPLTGTTKLILNIASREYVNGSYYFFTVDTVYVQNINQITQGSSYIEFLPAIDNALFYDSPYNTLNGSIQNQRRSSYIMQSDRYKAGTDDNPNYIGPLNIDLLLVGSASLATVQDSNYTSTSWTRARYEGAKTSINDYKAVPATTGTVFEGAEFPASSTPAEIQFLQQSGQLLYKTLFFTGVGDNPSTAANFSGYVLNGNTFGGTGIYTGITDEQTPITIRPEQTYGNIQRIPSPGDVYKIDLELVKVITAGRTNVGGDIAYVLDVKRGYNSVSSSHTAFTRVDKVEPVQIFNITGNKLAGVPKGQILVKQTGTLNVLDQLGFIVSSSNIY